MELNFGVAFLWDGCRAGSERFKPKIQVPKHRTAPRVSWEAREPAVVGRLLPAHTLG